MHSGACTTSNSMSNVNDVFARWQGPSKEASKDVGMHAQEATLGGLTCQTGRREPMGEATYDESGRCVP